MSASFITFARAHGVEIDPGKLYASDKIKRCPTTDKPRSTNGAYFWDGQRGWVFNWSAEARVQWFDDPNAAQWTEAEKQAWKARRAAVRADEQEVQRKAARRAVEMLRTAVPDVHDYLIRKRLSNVQGLVAPTGELLVPMRHFATNEIQGMQVIRWDGEAMKWEKKMIPGMKAKGAVLRLGPRNSVETVLVEGYATGLSVELAARQMRLSAAVLVCFSDSNMVHVAGLLKTGRRYVFADHDYVNVRTGTRAGHEAARQIGLPYCMSEVEGEDANDLHARAGLLAVCALMTRTRLQGAAVT